jgi:glycosyltransferase involved in cell wall biosynthesis
VNVGAVIPAYNESEKLPFVLSQVTRYISNSLICVVDDGSYDNTAQIASQFQVCLIQHPSNRGKGEALKSGFQWAVSKYLDGVITLDGDGQHDPVFIPKFIARMKLEKSDLIIGKRQFRMGNMPLDRICSNRFSSLITSLLIGKWIPDSQCGFRLIRTSLIKNISLLTNRFETETELLIKAAWAGKKIAFCSIDVKYEDENSSIHHFSDSLRFCQMLFRIIKEKNK